MGYIIGLTIMCKIDDLRTGKENDRRIKIPASEHGYIKRRYQQGESLREIARSYGVDKRLIQFILNPERLKRNRELRKERGGWRQYYNKDKWREEHRKHREYKKRLFEEGKIAGF